MKENKEECQFCGEETYDIHRHHLTPRSKGGAKGPKIRCCLTCSEQVHMLFTEKELANMSFEELVKTEPMKRYLNWKRKHPGDHKTRMSLRIRKKK
jgi:hypothetical protein